MVRRIERWKEEFNLHRIETWACLDQKKKKMMMMMVMKMNNNNNNNNNMIKNKKEKTCTLIDVAIPADRNVVRKEAEKKLKYKSLCIEIQLMWNLKCTIISIKLEPLE
jgi:hypothetical protein